LTTSGETFAAALSPEWQTTKVGRERFGSWEWDAWRWPDRRRPRAWVIFAVTPIESDAHRATRADIETWAAADIHGRYLRRRVVTVELELSDYISSDRREIISMQIGMSATQASQVRAVDIRAADEPLEFVPPEPPSLRLPTEELTERQALPQRAGVLTSDWLGPLRGRREVGLGEAAAQLSLPISEILELALQEVREGRLRVQQRGKEIYLQPVAGGPPE
jgi:hypothetical protein